MFESVSVLTPTGLGLFTSTAQIEEAAIYFVQPTVQVGFKCFLIEVDQHRGQTHFQCVFVFPSFCLSPAPVCYLCRLSKQDHSTLSETHGLYRREHNKSVIVNLNSNEKLRLGVT